MRNMPSLQVEIVAMSQCRVPVLHNAFSNVFSYFIFGYIVEVFKSNQSRLKVELLSNLKQSWQVMY